MNKNLFLNAVLLALLLNILPIILYNIYLTINPPQDRYKSIIENEQALTLYGLKLEDYTATGNFICMGGQARDIQRCTFGGLIGISLYFALYLQIETYGLSFLIPLFLIYFYLTKKRINKN